jgi:hypothetical protein
MRRIDPRSRLQWILILTGLGLTLIYAFVFLPLSWRGRSLDPLLLDAWRELTGASARTLDGFDALHARESLARIRASLASVQETGNETLARVRLEPEIERRLRENFQLIVFQNERADRIEALREFARKKGVSIADEVWGAFPSFPPDNQPPTLLWPQLAVLDHALYLACNHQIGAIRQVQILPPQSFRNPDGQTTGLYELPLRIDLMGSMETVAGFLLSLPLRAEEMKAAGLPEGRPDKPALFIDRLLLRKQDPGKRDTVDLQLRIVAFVYRD